jgi:excisionase family DNA binding protein
MLRKEMTTSAHPSLPFGESPEPPRTADRLLSVEELADYLEVPVKTIYTWRHQNTGPKGFRVGRHVRFRWQDVQAWVAQRIADEN